MSHQGPASASTSHEEKTQRLQDIIIIMNRCCKDMRRIIKRLTGLDNNDCHHRRKGEEIINKEDIKDQEPNEKTRLTSTMTSSILNHILTCAISQKSTKNCNYCKYCAFFPDFAPKTAKIYKKLQSCNCNWVEIPEKIAVIAIIAIFGRYLPFSG